MPVTHRETRLAARIMKLERACSTLGEQVEAAEAMLAEMAARDDAGEKLRELRKLRASGRMALRKAGVIP